MDHGAQTATLILDVAQRSIQLTGHVVEGGRQFADLVLSDNRNPLRQVAVAHGTCGIGHGNDGLTDAPGNRHENGKSGQQGQQHGDDGQEGIVERRCQRLSQLTLGHHLKVALGNRERLTGQKNPVTVQARLAPPVGVDGKPAFAQHDRGVTVGDHPVFLIQQIDIFAGFQRERGDHVPDRFEAYLGDQHRHAPVLVCILDRNSQQHQGFVVVRVEIHRAEILRIGFPRNEKFQHVTTRMFVRRQDAHIGKMQLFLTVRFNEKHFPITLAVCQQALQKT